MRLVKGDYIMVTDDDTVIRAYKLNGFEEKAEEVKKASSPKPIEPKGVKKK